MCSLVLLCSYQPLKCCTQYFDIYIKSWTRARSVKMQYTIYLYTYLAIFCMYNCNCFSTITFLNYCVQEVTTEQLQYCTTCFYYAGSFIHLTYFDIQILKLTDFVLYSKTVLLKMSEIFQCHSSLPCSVIFYFYSITFFYIHVPQFRGSIKTNSSLPFKK